MFEKYNISSDLLSEGYETFFNQTRTNFNLFYRGIVVDVNDPQKLGRAKIRIPSIHGTNKLKSNYVPDQGLPWATPAIWSSAGNDMGTFDPPTPGNRVFVTYEAGDPQYPIYFGGIPTKIGNTKYYKPQVGVLMGATQEIETDDYNLDMVTGKERVLYKSFKGATIIIDDFDGNEYIKIIDQSGQTFTMGNSGDMLPRRGNKLGTSAQSYMELSNNRGEKIRIEEGKVIIDGAKTVINSEEVEIPHYSGGTFDGYTKAETDALLKTKSRVFFNEPTIPYQIDDIWYNGQTVYRCINDRNSGEFSIDDWVIDTSFMTPEQVTRYVEQEGAKILETCSSTYVTPAYVDERINYEIYIHSSNGDIFKNDIIDTILTAYVRRGNYDISSQFADNQFIWTRVSDDKEGDLAWNRKYIGGCRSVRITSDDVNSKAVFNCELLDEINTVRYVKSGLIELFDGYDGPTSTGEWMSMIRTNTAIIPSSGVIYSEARHGYKFQGTSKSMQLAYPISLVPGHSYEFVTDLDSYEEVQEILHSNNDESYFATAVAGHLTVRKDTKALSAGNIKLNRKAYLSIRYADEDNMEVYYQGVYAGRFIQSGWLSTPDLLDRIGKYCSGYIHSIRVYNRLLTPTEIYTNYQEDLARFSD